MHRIACAFFWGVNMIYLDNAATSGKKPRSVINAVNYALNNLSANPGRGGYETSNNAAMAVYECRKAVKEFVNAESENNVCFTMNCTHAINTVLQGVLKEGDHIITSSLEHNAVIRPIFKLFLEKGVRYSIATVEKDDNTTVNNFKKLIRKNTKMIIITAASNVIGRALPLYEIGQLCKSQNILFAVDAAQAAGVLPIDMKSMNIDYLCIAPHKGFYAPMGTGILVAQKKIENVIITGGTGVNSLEMNQPEELPERIESGTVNLPCIVGIKSGIKFVQNKKPEVIYKHEMDICQRFYDQLLKNNVKVYTERPELFRFAPVISFNYKGFNSMQVGEFLAKNGIAVRSGLHCAPLAHKQIETVETGTVRVAPSVFNMPDDTDKLIFTLKKLI